MDCFPSSDFVSEPWIQLIEKIEVVQRVTVHPAYQMDCSSVAKAALVSDLLSVQQLRSSAILIEK
jgi:hypothetical protein